MRVDSVRVITMIMSESDYIDISIGRKLTCGGMQLGNNTLYNIWRCVYEDNYDGGRCWRPEINFRRTITAAHPQNFTKIWGQSILYPISVVISLRCQWFALAHMAHFIITLTRRFPSIRWSTISRPTISQTVVVVVFTHNDTVWNPLILVFLVHIPIVW